MNLILVHAEELSGDGEISLADRRGEHLRRVLRVKPGDRVRVGCLGGDQGAAEVMSVEEHGVRLRCHLDQPSPPAGQDVLLLAFARPKVLLRCLEHATALGFGHIVLFRCRRVERSHLSSSALTPDVYGERLRRGLEQSRRTRLPEVTPVLRFRELIEERLAGLATATNRYVADADAPTEAALAEPSAAPLTLAVGPEGGLSDHEISELCHSGFRAVRAGFQPLRVETALSYLAGQLRAARQCEAAKRRDAAAQSTSR